MISLFLAIIVLYLLQANCQDIDYYWRDYNGAAPKDAFPAGEDINGKSTYIGQVYIHHHGLFIGQITPPNPEVPVVCEGVKKVDHAIKVMCTQHKEKFQWIRTTSRSFLNDTKSKHLVSGGYNYVGYDGVIYIGRAMHQGILKIGEILSFNMTLYFAHRNRVVKAKTFDVLSYNNESAVEPAIF